MPKPRSSGNSCTDALWSTADGQDRQDPVMATREHTSARQQPILLRCALPTDVQRMAAIELASFSDPWPASAFADLLQQAHARIIVALGADQALLGYCVLLSAADEGEIANIAVAPSARRGGVGAQLLDDAIGFGTSEGVLHLFLEVRSSNESARRLYASRGFLPVGRRRAYYREPLEDALVLRRDASSAG